MQLSKKVGSCTADDYTALRASPTNNTFHHLTDPTTNDGNEMKQPISNGLFEVAGSKQPSERGFSCMQLTRFLTEEINAGGDNSWEYWHQRHEEANNVQCHYQDQCPIYAKTKKHAKQLTLF